MAYSSNLVDKVREYLSFNTSLKIEEKRMFGGLTFMVDGKMCVSVSQNNLMCRFDPILNGDISKKKGFQPLTMRGLHYAGYCYVNEDGYNRKEDLEFWLDLCLSFNAMAKRTKS